jgi:hypothetical protein
MGFLCVPTALFSLLLFYSFEKKQQQKIMIEAQKVQIFLAHIAAFI